MKVKKILISSLCVSLAVSIPVISVVATSCSSNNAVPASNRIQYNVSVMGISFTNYVARIQQNEIDKLKPNYNPATNSNYIYIKQMAGVAIDKNFNFVENVTYDPVNKEINIVWKNQQYELYNPIQENFPNANQLIPANGTVLNRSEDLVNMPGLTRLENLTIDNIYNNVNYPSLFINSNNYLPKVKQYISDFIAINKLDKSSIIYNDAQFYIKSHLMDKVLKAIPDNQKQSMSIVEKLTKFQIFASYDNFEPSQNNPEAVNGSFYFQFKNITNTPIELSINGELIKVNPNEYFTIKFLLVDSVMSPKIVNLNDLLVLSYDLSNVTISYQINNNNITNLPAKPFEFPISYTFRTKLNNVYTNNNIFTNYQEIYNAIPTDLTAAKNTIIEDKKAQFENLRNSLQYGLEIFEVINNPNITFMQLLTGIGNQLFYLFKPINIDLAIILGNLFSNDVPQFANDPLARPKLPAQVVSNAHVSGFLYNSYNAITDFISSFKNPSNAAMINSIISFLDEQLKNKPYSSYQSFITNITALKSTVELFLKNSGILSFEELQALLTLFDVIQKDQNIWVIIGLNATKILKLISPMISKNNPNLQQLFVIIINLIQNMKPNVNDPNSNPLDAMFWDFVTNNKTYLADLINQIKLLLPSISIIIDIVVDTFTNPKNHFTKDDILKLLTSVLGKANPTPEEAQIVPKFTNPNIKTLSQYFAKEFVWDDTIDTTQNILETDPTTKKVNGTFTYGYKFNSGATIDTKQLKHVVTTISILGIPISPFSGKPVTIPANSKITKILKFNNGIFVPYLDKSKHLVWTIDNCVEEYEAKSSKFIKDNLLNFFSMIIKSSVIVPLVIKPYIYPYYIKMNINDKTYDYFYNDIVNEDYVVNASNSNIDINLNNELYTLIGQQANGTKELKFDVPEDKAIIDKFNQLLLKHPNNLPVNWYYGFTYTLNKKNNEYTISIKSPIKFLLISPLQTDNTKETTSFVNSYDFIVKEMTPSTTPTPSSVIF